MRMSELVMAVMRVSTDVLDVEVRTSDDTEQTIPAGMVYIMVTTNLDGADLYDLRATIGQALEPRRPAGVGYEIVMKRPKDAVAIIGKTEAGPAREVQVFTSQDEVMQAFRGGYEVDTEYEMPREKPQRTRFNALADELTVEIAPLKKPNPTNQAPLTVPRLFEQTIDVKDRQVSPCPKCGCQAFTPAVVGGRSYMRCRGCPLPAPLFPTNNLDAWGASSQNYKCSSCAKVEPVTMLMSEINLYCGGCGKLSLHVDFSTAAGLNKKVMKATEAIVKFNDVVIGKVDNFEFEAEAIEEEDKEYRREVLGEFVNADGKTYVPGVFTGSITLKRIEEGTITPTKMTRVGEVPNDWVRAIEKMSEQVANAYGMAFEELTASPAAGLSEMFRIKLGFLPWKEFAESGRQLEGRNRLRRTGRTTRGLVFAIAEYMVNPNVDMFCVVARTEVYTRDLAKLARDMYEQLNLARAMPIRPLMPADFDPQYNYVTTQRAHVFVDHTWAEQMLNKR